MPISTDQIVDLAIRQLEEAKKIPLKSLKVTNTVNGILISVVYK